MADYGCYTAIWQKVCKKVPKEKISRFLWNQVEKINKTGSLIRPTMLQLSLQKVPIRL